MNYLSFVLAFNLIPITLRKIVCGGGVVARTFDLANTFFKLFYYFYHINHSYFNHIYFKKKQCIYNMKMFSYLWKASSPTSPSPAGNDAVLSGEVLARLRQTDSSHLDRVHIYRFRKLKLAIIF